MQAQTAVLSAVPESDSDKRRQILMGASEVFLEKGYDAASMSEIARVAGVSKGTLYVYFKNKEELFDSIVWGVCKLQSEQDFNIDNNDHDVTAVLTRFGTLVADMMCRPETISGLRVVIAISARMTEMGQRFYLEGPANTVAKLRSYLEAQNAAGILAVGDCELGRGAVHRLGHRHDVQAGAVQFRSADAGPHRLCGRRLRAHLPCGVREEVTATSPSPPLPRKRGRELRRARSTR